MATSGRLLVLAVALAVTPCLGQPAATQPVTSTAPAPAAATSQPAGAMISLNFPEGMPLKVLIDYVSQRTNMNLIYDDQVGAKRVTIKSPSKVPESSLLGLLESILKINDLALSDMDQKGWKRIVPATSLVNITKLPTEVTTEPGASTAISRVFKVEFVETSRIDQVVKPFLSTRGASTIDLADQGVLIVTDFASNMPRLAELIKLVDQPKAKVVIEFVAARNLEASVLAQQAAQFLTATQKGTGTKATADRVEIKSDARTNQIVLIGAREAVEEAKDVLRSLDVALNVETRMYQFQAAAPDRLDRLVKELIGPIAAKTLYQSALDKEGNILVVTTTKEIHERLSGLKADMDKPLAEGASPVRFYKLANATAADVIKTIQAIEGNEGLSSVAVEGLGNTAPTPAPGSSRTGDGAKRDSPPALTPAAAAPGLGPGVTPVAGAAGQPALSSYAGAEEKLHLSGTGGGQQTVQTKQARITADTNSNSIVVIAAPDIQRVYAQLIHMLDRRRPQVLVECTLVTLDTSRGYSFGVEISGSPKKGDTKVLLFDSFGLSDADKNTGRLTLKPGLGFNGAMLSPDIADIVVRALSTNARARVVSSPRVLVNDNASGMLASVNEAPFTSLNASSTVSTTSFAGYATAGTTITVTPHISEGDHLQLDYQVTLNSFTGQGSDTIPPPRQTNTVQSKVTIPDGHCIVVGGLNRKDTSTTVSGLPLLDQIPWLNWLAGNHSINDANTSLFVFIRPIILRDDEFEDLKILSGRDLAAAELPTADAPASEPMGIR